MYTGLSGLCVCLRVCMFVGWLACLCISVCMFVCMLPNIVPTVEAA